MAALVWWSAGIAHAGIIQQHVGQTNPTTEGWALDQNGTPTVSGDVDTLAYWQIESAAGKRANYQVNNGTDSTGFNDPSGWTMTAVAKLNSASDIHDAQFWADDGADMWRLNLVDGTKDGTGSLGAGIYASDTNNSPSLLSAMDPTAGYFAYQMVYDPAGDSGQGAMSYYVDGDLVATRTRSQVYTAPSNWINIHRIGFGDNTGGSASNSQWAMVTFETGQHPIPEPSACVLLAAALLGGLALAGRRTRT